MVEFFESFGDGVYNNKTNIWYIGNISSGEDAVLTLKVKVISEGIIENSVIVSANENDTDNSNNNASSDNVTANPIVDLSINKTVSPNSSYVGENITYTIVVVNNGPSMATNVTVIDKLSPLVKYLDSNSTVGTKFNDGNNTWFIGNLAKGENATLTIVVKVIGNGTVVNSAFVRSNENDTDDSNNNDSSDNVTAKPDVKLNVTKELVTVGPIYAGDNITYVIVISNNGVSEATGVKVTDTVSGDGVVVKCVDQDGKVYSGGDWVVDSIAAGKNVTLTVTVHVLANGTIANGVVVTAKENGTEVSNKTPDVLVYPDVPVYPLVDLSINKTVNTTLADVGKHLLYTITVVNNGPSTATNVTVTDELSPLVKYLDSNSSVGTKFDNKTNTWFVGNLAKGQNATLYITVEVTEKGKVINVVSVKSNENDTDDSNNNGSSNNVTVADAAFNASATPEIFPFRNSTVLNSTISNPNATGTVSYYFDDGTNPIEDIEIGQTVVYTPTSAGIHNITVVYSGDEHFNNVTVILTVNVTLGDAGFDSNATPDSIVFGDSTNLNSTVSDKGATGNVTYIFDDGTEPIVVDIGEIVPYEPLKAGNRTVTVIYSGDDNFEGATVYVNISVAKSDDSGFDANATPDVFPFRNSTVLNSTVSNPKATGNVSYYFDDDTPAVENIGIGETVNYTPNSAGIHNITVVYSGDDNFNGVTVVVTVNVTLGDAGFDANATPDSIVFGDSTNLNSTVSDKDATGNVTYIFDDGTDPVIADIGEIVNYTPLSAGNHTIEVIYSGDDNFEGATVYVNVTVAKSDDSGFSANATPEVFPYKDSTVLNSSVVNPNATGNVTYVFDDGSNVTVPVGTPVVYTPNSTGNHTVDVIYSGDDNFNGDETTIIVEVTPIDAGFNATVNATDVVYEESVELNSSVEFEDATGNVTYIFDDGTDPVVADIGEFVVYTPKSAGEHNITVVYSGDDNFVPETVVLTVNVSKSDDSGFDANATPDVFPYKDSTVLNSSVVNPNATGNVTYVFDDGSNVTVPVGTPVVYTPNSTGNHTVNVIYSGDDNFNGANKTITVEVTKIDAGFNATITPNETALTEPIYLNSSVIDKDATGNVTYIFDDGTVITTNIGEEVEYVPKEIGNHTVKVIYSGDDKFNGAEITLKYTIVESGLAVNITAITKTVVVGDQIVFNITVFNGGNIPLTRVVVSQIEIGSLDYVKLMDDSNLWIEITNELSENGLLQASSDLRSWRYLGILYPGESASFNAVYDTYVPGTFDNGVIATSDEAESVWILISFVY